VLRTHISNRYLNEDKVITAKTQWELDQKVNNQKQKWKEKENKIKEQMKLSKIKEKAIADTKIALELINQYGNLLLSSLKVKHILKWDELYNKEVFIENEPKLETFTNLLNVPKEDKFIELIFTSVKNKRLEKEKEAERLHSEAVFEYQYGKNQFINDQKEINQSVDQFKQGYETAIAPFVERYFGTVLDKSVYPVGMIKNFDAQYLSNTKTLLIEFDLPNPENIPNIIEYKFIQTRKEVISKSMKKNEFDEFYQEVIYQITLRTVYECFSADYANTVELIVFNGWVHGIDTSTGQDFHSCIIILQTTKVEYLSLHLDKVVPKECFRNLKGINAGALSQLAPVRPILELNRDDKRFVESKEILADINSIPNLAAMPWEDFEHLVRELFEHYFSSVGAEVKVTKASRDGGIDAVAFDPDPIRGGKFIIQAKRYNHVVPISAVRELNGIMGDEGAVKGILVTTSYYGNDSREFAKGKPLTLLDGSNLIQMFNDYGYKVRIELNKKEKAN
jgi:restriction system protein